MKLKSIFIKNISTITIIFPLIIILFYGISTSITLKYRHQKYEKSELKRYEEELKSKHDHFFKEKIK